MTDTGRRNMNIVSALLLAAVSLVLGACGGSLKVTTPEVDNAEALHSASAFHVRAVDYTVTREPGWEISDAEWQSDITAWTAEFGERCTQAGRPVYVLGAGSEPTEGAVIELEVAEVHLGEYGLVSKHPGRIGGTLTIRDVSTGDVLFRGAIDSPGSTVGDERYSYAGRVRHAHLRVADDVAWLINREPE